MKSKISIAVFSLALSVWLYAADAALACTPIYWQPSEMCLLRACDDRSGESTYSAESRAADNCRLWRGLTSSKIPLEDIHCVVYKYSVDDVRHIGSMMESAASDSLMGNEFVRWLVDHRDREIVEFLIVAKLCEQTRENMNSLWYYPAAGDSESAMLAHIVRCAETYDGSRLRDRYALQAVRALFASGRYDACIDYWNGVQASLPDGLIKDMMMPYVGGAYYRMGDKQHALSIYSACDDYESMMVCCCGEDWDALDSVGRLERLYEYNPDMPELAATVQSQIRDYENYFHRFYDDYYMENMRRLRDFACRAAHVNRASDPALWYYLAAYLTDLCGDPRSASDLCAKAERVRGSSFIHDSIKVLRIWLDAKLCRYDAAYEHRLLGQLQWLDEKLHADIDGNVFEGIRKYDYINNISYYYWNDAMRRILLSVVVPRYIEQGDCVRAIQLANMADNDLLDATDCFYTTWESGIPMTAAEYRSRREEHNYHDYRGALFNLVDTVGLDHLMAYKQRLDQPRSRFDRFVNSRSYRSADYFNDLIGTQCLRQMRYADAVRYLQQVSPSFQHTLNTYKEGYMRRDPFSLYGTKMLDDNTDYKYEFARRMMSLEQSAAATSDPCRKARLQLQYVVGLHNSIHSCWALTQYGYIYDWYDDITSRPEWKLSDERCRTLIAGIDAGLSDDQSAVEAYNSLGDYGKDWGGWDYHDPYLSRYVNRRCDRASDYVAPDDSPHADSLRADSPLIGIDCDYLPDGVPAWLSGVYRCEASGWRIGIKRVLKKMTAS